MQTETRKLWEQAGQVEGRERAEVLLSLGGHLLEEEELTAAIEVVGAASDLFAAAEDWRMMALCAHNTGVLLAADERPDEAADAHRRAADLYRQAGDDRSAAVCTSHHADLVESQGDPEGAVALHVSAAESFESHRRMYLAGMERRHAGSILLDLDRPREALAELKRSRQLLRGAGPGSEVATCDLRIGLALGRLRKTKPALKALDAARAVFSAGGSDECLDGLEETRAEVYLFAGQLDAAEVFAEVALEHGRECEDMPLAARSLLLQSRIYLAGGRPSEALDAATEAAAVFDALGSDEQLALAGFIEACALRQLRRPAQASAALASARTRLDESSACPHVRNLAELYAA